MKHYLEMPETSRMTQRMILTEIFAREASVKNKFFTRKFVATPQSL